MKMHVGWFVIHKNTTVLPSIRKKFPYVLYEKGEDGVGYTGGMYKTMKEARHAARIANAFSPIPKKRTIL